LAVSPCHSLNRLNVTTETLCFRSRKNVFRLTLHRKTEQSLPSSTPTILLIMII
jgi:hypothetical protein